MERMSDRTRPGMDEILAKLGEAAESATAVLEVLGCRESVVLDRVLRQKDTYFRVNQSRYITF